MELKILQKSGKVVQNPIFQKKQVGDQIQNQVLEQDKIQVFILIRNIKCLR